MSEKQHQEVHAVERTSLGIEPGHKQHFSVVFTLAGERDDWQRELSGVPCKLGLFYEDGPKELESCQASSVPESR